MPSALVAEVEGARVFAPRIGERGAVQNFEVIHTAIVAQLRLTFDYPSDLGTTADRTVRPLGLYFWGRVWTLAAWCELRNDFRSFRIDRLANIRAGHTFVEEPTKTREVFLAQMRAQASRE